MPKKKNVSDPQGRGLNKKKISISENLAHEGQNGLLITNALVDYLVDILYILWEGKKKGNGEDPGGPCADLYDKNCVVFV